MTEPGTLPWDRGIQAAGRADISSARAAEHLLVPGLLWLALWFGINSGPWVLERPAYGTIGLVHWLRTVISLGVLPVALVGLAHGMGHGAMRSPPALKWWLAYGLVALGACAAAPEPLESAYWAVLYLGTLAATALWLRGRGAEQTLRQAVLLNYLSWIVPSAFLLAMMIASWDALFANGSGYSAYGMMSEIGGMAMSRSSGISRFAGVSAVVCIVMALRRPGMEKAAWAAAALALAWLIYYMQSRGAMFAVAAAFAFIMLFHGRRLRTGGVFLLLLLAGVAILNPDGIVDRIGGHIQRGQDAGGLLSMTGRTRAWENAIHVAWQSPVWGYGPQADRELIGEHVHNSYLYALLAGGLLGLGAFAAGMGYAWLSFYRVIRSGIADRLDQKFMVVATGGILAFFTVRSVPEVSGAMYGVDLMVMLPAMAYLGVLDHCRHSQLITRHS